MSQPADIQLKVERFHLAVRLKTLHFPFSLEELKSIAEAADYSVPDQLKSRLPELPSGASIQVSGPIAEDQVSGNVFRLDMSRGIVAIAGRDVDSVLTDFKKFEDLIADKLVLRLEEQARFYEYILDADAYVPGRNPMDEISSLFQDSSILGRFSSELGFDAINFGVRLATKGSNPNEDRWTDTRIEPSVSRPMTTYSINSVYRNESRQKVFEAAKALVSQIKGLLQVIYEAAAR